MRPYAGEALQRVLVVDDEEGARLALSQIAADDYHVVCVADGARALERIERATFDLVLLDTGMPGIDGLETLKRIKALDQRVEVIMVSAIDRAKEAVASIKLGAYDYIIKPVQADIILSAMTRAMEKNSLRCEGGSLRPKAAAHAGHGDIIGDSEGMQAVAAEVNLISRTSSNVLISGESGTGKELIARAIHAQGSRSRMPFVAINCAAIPRELMESEVFGHEKGAFSGAHRKTAGKFAFAAGGSVFLDEIASMDICLQAKLLRFLQDRQVTPVGSAASSPVDVRIIAATNTCLKELVRQRQFREDLYFRLNVLPIRLPPLRDRRGDVGLLGRYFLKRTGARLNKQIKGFSPRAMEILDAYDWPGNVRELENVVERMVVMGTDGQLIGKDDLPAELLPPGAGTDRLKTWEATGYGLTQARSTFERQYILQALESCDWNQSAAARQLRIHRNTLIQKMRALGISARSNPWGSDRFQRSRNCR